MHPWHAKAEFVAVGKGPTGHQCGDHPDTSQFGQGSQRIGSPSLEDPATHVENWSLGGPDEVGRCRDEVDVDLGLRVVARQIHLDTVGPRHGRPGVGRVHDVLGDVDQHRPGTSRGGDVERLLDNSRDVLGLGDQKVVLGDRLSDARRIALLEGIGSDRCVGHLSGHHDHGHRIEVGVA